MGMLRTFGEITGERLRELNSIKNVQNSFQPGRTDVKTKSLSEPNIDYFKPKTSMYQPKLPVVPITTTKRAREPEFDLFGYASDGNDENLDPGMGAAKRYKGIDGAVTKSTLYQLGMPATHGSTVNHTKLSAKTSDFPGGLSTVPAGRSPPRTTKTVGRPYRGIYPPMKTGATSDRIPSMSEVVAGTIALNDGIPMRTLATPKSRRARKLILIFEEVEIVQSTQDVTGGIDRMGVLSAEDKEAELRKEGGNKENEPPAGYVSLHTGKNSIVNRRRARKTVNAMATNYEPRVVLAELLLADFVDKSIDASSFFIIPADEDLPSDEAIGMTSERVITQAVAPAAFSIAEDA